MLRQVCRLKNCAFSIGFLVGVIIACLVLNSENETSIQTSCNVRGSSKISYKEWFSMQNLKRHAVNYYELSHTDTAAGGLLSEASYLYSVVHVHCVVFVKKTRNAFTIKNTWAKRCNEVIFFGLENSSDISVIVLRPKSSWQYLCDAIRYLWQNNKENLHWALFVPDDIFAIPENLRYYVASLDYNEPHYLGNDITFWGNAYNVGGAGYVLSKGVIYALQMKFNSSESCLKSGKYWRNEDFYLGKHLGGMGITPTNTKDNSGCNRFQRYNLNYVMDPHTYTVPSSGHSLSSQITPGCYSDHVITFNGIEPDKFYLYDYLLYRVKVFPHGVTLGSQPPPVMVSEDKVWREFVREEGLGEPADISPKQYFELWQRKIQSPEVFNALLRQQSDAMFSSDDMTSPQSHGS